MDDLEIINQLLKGLHLSKSELKRAYKIIGILNIELESRFKRYNIK